jgi:uridine kinase
VILFEGILSLYDPRICDLMQYKIFMHCDDDIRLCRRIVRDVKERGRDVEGVLF